MIIVIALLAIIASTLLFGAHITLIVLGLLATGLALRAAIHWAGLGYSLGASFLLFGGAVFAVITYMTWSM